MEFEPAHAAPSAEVVDDLCLIRSMRGESVNHHPAQSQLMTGSPLLGRPTIGAWTTYGLGSESQDLPGFVVLKTGNSTQGSTGNWSNGFLPSTYQGVLFRSEGDPILHLSNPNGVSGAMQREDLDVIRDLNQAHLERTGDQEIASRISAYELAYRMQAEAPGLMQGVSQLDVWRGEEETARSHVLVENRHQPSAVHLRTYIDERYKLTVYRGQPYGELFDLEDDPNEIRNRWDDPEYAGIKGELMHRFLNAEMAREATRMPRIAGA